MLYTDKRIVGLGIDYYWDVIKLLEYEVEDIGNYLEEEIYKCGNSKNFNSYGVSNIVSRIEKALLKEILNYNRVKENYSMIYGMDYENLNIRDLIEVKAITLDDLSTSIELFEISDSFNCIDEFSYKYKEKKVEYLQANEGYGDTDLKRFYLSLNLKDGAKELEQTHINGFNKSDIIDATEEDYSYTTETNKYYNLSLTEKSYHNLKYILVKYIAGKHNTEDGESINEIKYTLYVLTDKDETCDFEEYLASKNNKAEEYDGVPF